jgi:tetratricopeptide (TPR) repeat protein
VTSGSSRRFFLFLLLLPALAWGEGKALEHLLLGADAFRAGQFSVALVEFRFAEAEEPSSEASWYAAAALVKLHRTDEALEAFAAAEARAPAARDALFDFYQALACYDARLYTRADTLLSRIDAPAGPHLVEQATKLRARLTPVLSAATDAATADWYRAESSRLRTAGFPRAAALFDVELSAVLSRQALDGGRPK